MLLAIDVGNTNIVFALLQGDVVLSRSRTQTLRNGTKEDYIAVLRGSGLLLDGVDGAVLSSVVPETDAAVMDAVKALTGLTCLQVTPALRMDMPICLDQPETLAADIICGCVGARTLTAGPVAVVDMGTATTIVVMDREGRYRGGAIMPGVKLGLGALTAGTSLLPDLTITKPGKVIATETVESLLSGAVYGAAAMIDGVVSRMEEELGDSLEIVITGGLGAVVRPYCKRRVRYDEDLVFRGMAALYEKNQ